jgi:hypothetical protein
MTIPMVGQVTTAPDAKLHLINGDNGHCNAGDRRIITGTAIQLADANPDMLCRRCLVAIRAAADEELRNAAGGGRSQYRQRSVEPLRRVRDAIRTDAEKAKAIDFKTKLALIRAQTPQREYKPSAFALIKQGHADANQPALLAA